VKFKNETAGEYYPAISTRQKTEAEAMKTAFAWLRDGIPKKRTTLKVSDLYLKDTARKIKTKDEAENLVNNHHQRWWLECGL